MVDTKTQKRIRKPRVRKRKTKEQIRDEAKSQMNSPQNNFKSTTWIIAPSGKCPVFLDGNSPEEIDQWVEKVKKTGNHTVQSICYWVRDFYESFSQENKDIRKYIEDNSSKYNLRNTSSHLLVQSSKNK